MFSHQIIRERFWLFPNEFNGIIKSRGEDHANR